MDKMGPVHVGCCPKWSHADSKSYNIPRFYGHFEFVPPFCGSFELRESCRPRVPAAALYTHYQDLIETSQLDAVVICLPPALHAKAAIACFERGLHVYLEKPLATTLEDGERIIRAWRQAGTQDWIGFNFRFHPLVVEMRDALRNGAVGTLVAVRVSFCVTFPVC